MAAVGGVAVTPAQRRLLLEIAASRSVGVVVRPSKKRASRTATALWGRGLLEFDLTHHRYTVTPAGAEAAAGILRGPGKRSKESKPRIQFNTRILPSTAQWLRTFDSPHGEAARILDSAAADATGRRSVDSRK